MPAFSKADTSSVFKSIFPFSGIISIDYVFNSMIKTIHDAVWARPSKRLQLVQQL